MSLKSYYVTLKSTASSEDAKKVMEFIKTSSGEVNQSSADEVIQSFSHGKEQLPIFDVKIDNHLVKQLESHPLVHSVSPVIFA